jgi:hypothetical protein
VAQAFPEIKRIRFSGKRMLLKKAYAALPKDGALIVYEAIVDDERREHAD